MEDHYKTLEASPGATQEEITASYGFLAKAFHSDRNQSELEKAPGEDQVKKVNFVYEVLSDPSKGAA